MTRMIKITRALVLLLALPLVALLNGCERPRAQFNPASAESFFPLKPSTVWSYRVDSKSQRQTYVVTDKVLGVKYLPALNITGEVVEEYYDLDRGGSRPIVYVVKDGYLTRLSGLEYSKGDIRSPAWGRSEDGEFMPARMVPEVSWSSTIFPFGHMPDAFDIKQTHRTVFEPEEIVVPAGHYLGCIRIDTLATYEGGSYERYKKRPANLLYRDWYAPNVGLIRTEVTEGGLRGPQLELVELLKFVNPAAN